MLTLTFDLETYFYIFSELKQLYFQCEGTSLEYLGC